VQVVDHSGQPDLVEYWTVSRSALALMGPPVVLQTIARELDLPAEAVIIERPGAAVLGLWEDALENYLRWRCMGRRFPAA
jgi:hypothetical protein